MPVALTIVCNLERLAALDVFDRGTNSIRLGFGLNLAPGAKGGTLDELRPFVSPWTWRIDGVQIQWAPNPPVAGDIIDQGQPALNDLVTRLNTDLDDYASRLGELDVPQKQTTAADQGPGKAKTAFWPPRLLHLATYPFPIPQTLNLSRIFRVDIAKLKPDVKPADYFKIPAASTPANNAARKKWLSDNLPDVKALAAAPVLGATGPFADARIPDDAGPTGQNWAYKLPGSTSPTITAFVDLTSVAPPSDGFVDMASQWIRAAATKNFEENWQAYLEVRTAEAFRLPEFFAEYLRGHANDAADQQLNASAGLAASVADVGIALIADCAGFGLIGASAAKGNSLAERLFATVDKVATQTAFALTPAQLQELEGLTHNFYKTLQRWKDRLSTSIDSLKSCELLKGQPKAMSVVEVGTQFQRVLDQVFATEQQDKKNDQINLWKVYQDQWIELLGQSTLPSGLKDQILKALAGHATPQPVSGQPQPRRFDLRARLAQENIDRFWSFFTASNNTGDADGLNLVQVCFPAYLKYYASVRFGLTTPPVAGCTLPSGAAETALRDSFPLACPQAPAALTDIPLGLDTRATKFKDFLLPKPDQNFLDNRVPQGLTFSLGRVESNPASAQQTAANDILEKSSGSVVLMRETGAVPQPWRVLNYAETWLQTKVLRQDPTVVPYKVHYRGNLKQTLVTYDNRAITADSQLSEPILIGGYVQDDNLDYSQAFLRFRYCGANAFANPGSGVPLPPAYTAMPGLKFGKSYQLAAFVMTNSGIPPSEVAATGVPWQVNSTLAATINIPPEAIIGGGTGLKYLRRVKVGSLRIKPVIARDANDPRVIPPDVSPRAREYEFFDDGTPTPPKSSEVPLVLLAPGTFRFGKAGSIFSFDVRPPATSWECWDRWLAFDESVVTTAQRGAAIGEIYRLTRNNQNNSNPDDVTVEDPAVHTSFRIELHLVQDNGKLTPKDSRLVEFGAPGAPPLKQFQRMGRRVNCVISSTTEGITEVNGEVQVSVKEGELYRLALSPAIPKEFLDRFANEPVKPADPPLAFRSPSYFAIEVATALPDAKSPAADALRDLLWKASSCTYHIDSATGKEAIRVDLNPSLATDPRFRYFHRAVSTHQAWRWTGRPAAPHPAFLDKPTADDLAKWEAREFGDRSPLESIPHPMAVLPRPDMTKITSVRSYRFEITPRDSKGRYDERGQHHRMRVEAWSRYEGLLTGAQNPSLVATLKVATDTNQWLSLFVPSRLPVTNDLPGPKVKLILPLTQSEPDDALVPSGKNPLRNLQDQEKQHRTAGLLVVLNEPWYETGGLGEEIEAAVDLAASPDNKADDSPDKRVYFRQAGPDPIVNVDGFRKAGRLLATSVSASYQSDLFDPKAIVGPVGHYFDADNTSALFVATSFILPPPTLPPSTVASVTDVTTPWYMARVAFRRKLTTFTPPAATPPDYPDPTWKRNTRYSPYTDPLWVQYLPEFSLYDNFSDRLSKLHLDVAQSSLRLLDASGAPQSLKPTASDNNIFSLYLVLTRMVNDVIGRPDQETYVATFQADAVGTWTPVPNAEKFDRVAGPYRARLIEVQTPQLGPVSADGCWKRPIAHFWDQFFFTDEPRCDTPARITRISEPIDQPPPVS